MIFSYFNFYILATPIRSFDHAHQLQLPGLCKMADTKDLLELLERRIPDARKALRDSHKNLEGLANYCETNYVESGQSTQFLEETKQYTAQSLASVAYQVNILATGMLELLDAQMKHMNDMESNVRHISQVSN